MNQQKNSFNFNQLYDRIVFFFSSIFPKIRLKDLLFFVLIQVAIVLISFVIFGLLPVRKEVNRISSLLDSTAVVHQANPSENDMLPELSNLKRYEDFLKSQMQLSKNDSIALLIDLLDSTASIVVKGVPLLTTKISHFELSNGLKKIPDYYYTQLFSKPLLVQQDLSTVEKFPIVIKIAPKDTIEAQQVEKAPEAPALLDVYFNLEFADNLTIEIKQQEKNFVGPGKNVRHYQRLKRKKEYKKFIEMITGKEKVGYSYRIEIEISRDDALSIYRALPVKPYVLVRYR